jgi:threonine dehydrogenase-like Zn-dependent dehydrogenase
MRAVAVFPSTREVALVNVEEPGIARPTQVKLRMLEVGICGTDKEICHFTYGTPPPGSDYLIIGHEALAEVIEVGSAVAHLRKGDLVVPTVRRPCLHPECRPCRTGNQDFCSTGDFTERGIKGLHGFMAEYAVEEAEYLTAVPEALRDVAVLVEPLTITAKALFQTLAILERLPWFSGELLRQPGERTYHAVVLGAGAVGLLGALALTKFGFATYVYDRAPAPNAKSRLVD